MFRGTAYPREGWYMNRIGKPVIVAGRVPPGTKVVGTYVVRFHGGLLVVTKFETPKR